MKIFNIKINLRLLLIAAAAVFLAVLIPILVFNLRSPVLIVIENSFVLFYGEKRLEKDISGSSRALFRSVKVVNVSNEASDDIIPYIISEVSKRPYCVIFPSRFSGAASFYNVLNPSVRIVILEGRNSTGSGNSDFFTYKTDIDTDFYRAGLAAAAFDNNKKEKIIVFIHPHNQQAINAFLRGINEQINPPQVLFFSSFLEFSENFPEKTGISCVVLCGAGSEFFDEKIGVPVILFSWTDPSLVPLDVVMIFDDSPLAQVNRVMAMVSSSKDNGVISSNLSIFNRININRQILRKIKKI
ncbi:MAG: hypothetical protein FWD24_00500 [Treponema sp.]|nr:hypothetical protein [Treponema sp.]